MRGGKVAHLLESLVRMTFHYHLGPRQHDQRGCNAECASNQHQGACEQCIPVGDTVGAYLRVERMRNPFRHHGRDASHWCRTDHTIWQAMFFCGGTPSTTRISGASVLGRDQINIRRKRCVMTYVYVDDEVTKCDRAGQCIKATYVDDEVYVYMHEFTRDSFD